MKKRVMGLLTVCLLIGVFSIFALGSGEEKINDQGESSVVVNDSSETENTLGDYLLEIKSCRLAKDYEGKDVAIVMYNFTNNAEDAASFMFAFEDNAYQNGVGLNEAYVLPDSANYSSDNQTKEIKKGASLDIEVAYELNDATSDIEVEVGQLFSFDESIITKTFSLGK